MWGRFWNLALRFNTFDNLKQRKWRVWESAPAAQKWIWAQICRIKVFEVKDGGSYRANYQDKRSNEARFKPVFKQRPNV